MGNQLSIPNKESVKSNFVNHIFEYRKIGISQLEDAYNYWLYDAPDGNMKLPWQGFEDVFSGIVADPQAHFDIFADMSGVACNPQHVFLTLAILSDCPASQRLNFMLRIYMRHEKSHADEAFDLNLTTKDIQGFCLIVLQCTKKFFDIRTPEASEVNYYVSSGLTSFIKRTANNMDAPASPVKSQYAAHSDTAEFTSSLDEDGQPIPVPTASTAARVLTRDVQLSLAEFTEWIQDASEISSFLSFSIGYFQADVGSVYDFAMLGNKNGGTRFQDLDEDFLARLAGTALDANRYEFLRRHQNPLWTHAVHDMADESWYREVPILYGRDSVFVALEHSVLGCPAADGGAMTTPLLVMRQNKGLGLGLGSSVTGVQSTLIGRQVASKTSLGGGGGGGGGGMHVASSVIGLTRDASSTSNVGLHAASSSGFTDRKSTSANVGKAVKPAPAQPFNLMATGNLLAQASLAPGRAVSGLRAGLNVSTAATLAALHHGGAGAGLIDIFDCSSLVALIAASCPDGVVDKALDPDSDSETAKRAETEDVLFGMNSYRSHALARHRAQDNQAQKWTEVGLTVASTTLEELPDCPLLSHRPRLAAGPTLHMEHLAYSAIELIAKRYRAIPVATDPSQLHRATHVLTGLNVAKFLRRHETDLFGTDLDRSVLDVGLLRRPQYIPRSANLGTAITILARVDTEASLITREDGEVCGIVSAEDVRYFWHHWWTQNNAHVLQKDSEKAVSLGDLAQEYAKGSFAHYTGSGTRGFAMFSSLTWTLDACVPVGIRLEGFKRFAELEPSLWLCEPLPCNGIDPPVVPTSATVGKPNLAIATDAATAASRSARSSPAKSKSKLKGKGKSKSKGKGREDAGEALVEPRQLHQGTDAVIAIGAAGIADPRRSGSPNTAQAGAGGLTTGDTEINKKDKSKGKVKGKKGKRRRAMSPVLSPQALEALRIAEALRKAEQERQDDIAHHAAYHRWLDCWFAKHRAVRNTDTLRTALRKMCDYRCTKVFVVSAEDGRPWGSLSLVDLCRKVLEDESTVCRAEFEQYRLQRAEDIVVRSTESFN